jgi:murein DD-endopeptidase MepM/ murein hydrolase activator NlpD
MQKRKKTYVAVVAVVLVLLLVFSIVISVIAPLAAGAVSQSEIDALEAQKQQITDKKNEIQNQINDLTAQQATYLERKAALDEQNELCREEIEIINEQIVMYNELVVKKKAEVEEAKKVEQEQAERLRVRMRAMEESGSVSYLSIVFQARTFSDLLSRIDFVSEIMEYDKWLEESYIAAREYAQQVQAEYEATLKEKEEKQDELIARKAELEEQIAAANEMIKALEEDIDEFTAAYNENEAAEAAVQADIDAMIAELQRQEAAAAAAAAAAGNSNYSGSAYGTGAYMWPVSTTVNVSSQFGWRIHPIFGTERFHSGIDISAYAGDSIYAADTGYVSIAQYSSSYGNYVVINHGNGNTTLYAHMSSMAVSAGDYVTKGDTIGYVGSTGWSTGPHLHFEITSGGTRVDPLGYFSNYNIV